jgi:predicted O-methyltransferase YrrM
MMDVASRAIEIVKTEGLVAFARKAYKYIKQRLLLLLPYAVRKVKAFDTKYRRSEAVVDFSFNGSALIHADQVYDEILQLANTLREARPKTILEIGTAGGGTLFLLCHMASANATIISVDLPGGKFGGGYPAWKTPLYKSFASRGQTLCLIRDNSHQSETLEKVKSVLGEQKVDFLFIDGDHTYNGVKQDFEMYYHLVTDGGIAAFHDIVPGLPESVGGVPQFWQEIKGQYETAEIVKDWGQGGYGIGLIYKKSQRETST